MKLPALTAAVVAGTVLPASPTVAQADPGADPSPVGAYTFEAEDGENGTWNVTMCPGDPPGCVRVFESGNPKRASWNGEAHYSVGSWILLVQQSDAMLCEDGTAAPGLNTYSWDNATLSGNISILTRGACDAKAASLAIPFRLTKVGSGPVQYPTAPVEVLPNPAPAASAPNAAAPGADAPPPAVAVAPLPAESSAGS